MIFLTVGTQLGFDRLLKSVDELLPGIPDCSIFAQIGDSKYKPFHFAYVKNLSPADFDKNVEESELVISHAGMGTILKSLLFKKTVIVFPRLASLQEHRNNHQVATVEKLKLIQGLYVAFDKCDLEKLLTNKQHLLRPLGINEYASESLINSLKNFIAL